LRANPSPARTLDDCRIRLVSVAEGFTIKEADPIQPPGQPFT
jgi:hypothetical protein